MENRSLILNVNPSDEVQATTKESRQSCWRRHSRAIGLASGIGLLLIVAAVLAITFGGRSFIESRLEEARLELDSLQLNATTLAVSLAGHLASTPNTFGLSVTFNMTDVQLYNEKGDQFGALAGPLQLSIAPGSNSSFIFASQLVISNESVWGRAGAELLQRSRITWRLSGVASVQVSFLYWSDLRWNKTVSAEGCGGLDNAVRVVAFDMIASTEYRVVADLQLVITNPSSQVGVVGLSGVEFALWAAENVTMGRILTNGPLSLAPASSSVVSLTLNIDSNDVSEPVQHEFMSRVMTAVLARHDVNLTAVGLRCATPFFSYIVASLRITAQLTSTIIASNVPPLIQSFELVGLSVQPLNSSVVQVGFTVSLVAMSPLGPDCPFELVSISMDTQRTQVMFNQTSVVGRALFEPIYNRSLSQRQVGPVLIVNSTLDGLLLLEDTEGNSTESTFTTFVEYFLDSTAVSVGVFGWFDAAVCLPALGGCARSLRAAGVPIQISTDITGMAGLQQVRLDSVSLPANTPDGRGLEIAVNVSVYNPSVVSLTLGVDSGLCMDTLFEGSSVAIVNSSSGIPVALGAGWSAYTMAGVVAPADLNSASIFFSQYMKGISSVVQVRAIPACAPVGLHWLRKVMERLSVQVNVSGLTDFELVHSVHIDELLMDFEHADIGRGIAAISSGTITASWRSPFQFPFQVYRMAMWMNMLFEGEVFARLELPRLPTRSGIHSPGDGWVVVTFQDVAVRVENFAGFSRYVDALVLGDRTTMGIAGSANLSTALSFGNCTLFSLPFAQQVGIRGVDSFKCAGCISARSVDLVGGEPGKGYFTLQLGLRSEATASLFLGRLAVQIHYAGSLLGVGVISHASLLVGNNSFIVHATLVQSSDNSQAVRLFFSNFVQGAALPVEMHGFSNGTDIPVAASAFAQLNASTVIPGSSERLVRYGQLIWSWKIFKLVLPVRLTIFNPYNASISLTAASFIVSFKGKRIASVSVNWEADPVTIPAQSLQITRNIDASIEGVSLEFLRTLFGEIHISVVGTLQVLIGTGFRQTIDYVQNDIPASFRKE